MSLLSAWSILLDNTFKEVYTFLLLDMAPIFKGDYIFSDELLFEMKPPQFLYHKIPKKKCF